MKVRLRLKEFEFNLLICLHWNKTFDNEFKFCFTDHGQNLTSPNDNLAYFLGLIFNCFDKSIQKTYTSRYKKLETDYENDMENIIEAANATLHNALDKIQKVLYREDRTCLIFTDTIYADHEAEFKFLWISRLSSLSFACENLRPNACSNQVKDETKKTLFRFVKNIVRRIHVDDKVMNVTCKEALERIGDEKFSDYSFDKQEEDFRTVKETCLSTFLNKYATWNPGPKVLSPRRDCVIVLGWKCNKNKSK
jgi:hypothetical protein